MRRNQKGFTLIELLIVVAIIGILAAIAIPNLLTAMQRSKQKRTMADIRSIATAWEARATDINGYNAAGWDWPATDVSFPALAENVSPTYIRTMPQRDGWNTDYQFAVVGDWGATTARPQVYGIRSAGKDAGYEGNTYENLGTTRYECDIVYSNGSFVQFPDGMQIQD
jgi:type II secretion system protein G